MKTPKVGAANSRVEVVAELEVAQTQANKGVAARLAAPMPAPKGGASKVRAQAQPRGLRLELDTRTGYLTHHTI